MKQKRVEMTRPDPLTRHEIGGCFHKATWVIQKIVEAKHDIIQCPALQGTLVERLGSVQKVTGKFAIKKLYTKLLPQFPKVPWKSLALKHTTHPRHNFILWLALKERLATVDRLLKFNIQTPMLCVFCGRDIETLRHLYFTCQYTNQLWCRVLTWLGMRRVIGTWDEEVQWMSNIARKKSARSELISSMFAMIVNVIWRERNKARFQQAAFQVDVICKEVMLHAHIQSQQFRAWQHYLSGLPVYP